MDATEDVDARIRAVEEQLCQMGEIGFDYRGDLIEYLIEHPDSFLPPADDD